MVIKETVKAPLGAEHFFSIYNVTGEMYFGSGWEEKDYEDERLPSKRYSRGSLHSTAG